MSPKYRITYITLRNIMIIKKNTSKYLLKKIPVIDVIRIYIVYKCIKNVKNSDLVTNFTLI